MSRIALLASSATLALFASPALAQQTTDETDVSIEEAEPPQEQIVVIGTRRTDRSAADSPVPIDVIGGDALNNSGYTEVNKVLNQLVPSYNFPSPRLPTVRMRCARQPCGAWRPTRRWCSSTASVVTLPPCSI